MRQDKDRVANLENKLESFTMGMAVEVCVMIKRIHQVRERMRERAGREGEGWRETETKNRETPFW